MAKIERLQQMRAGGAISDEEFEIEKDKIIRSKDWFPYVIGAIVLVTALVSFGLWSGLSDSGRSISSEEGSNSIALSNESLAVVNEAESVDSPTEETGPQFVTRDYKADPKIASFAGIASDLNASALQILKPDPDTDCTRDSECFQSVVDEVEFSSPVLVSVRRTTDQFLGGAHGSASVSDFNYLNGKQVRFGELFSSWTDAKSIIQKQFCERLLNSQPREVTGGDGYSCPNIDDTALNLSGSGNVSSISIATSDYQLGYYAAGRAHEMIPLTPELVGLLRPEIAQLAIGTPTAN